MPVLVVGPPPVADPVHTGRAADVDEVFAAVCRHNDTPYVSVLKALQHGTWLAEATAVDGSHPAAGGYQEMADLIYPTWWRWLHEPARLSR